MEINIIKMDKTPMDFDKIIFKKIWKKKKKLIKMVNLFTLIINNNINKITFMMKLVIKTSLPNKKKKMNFCNSLNYNNIILLKKYNLKNYLQLIKQRQKRRYKKKS